MPKITIKPSPQDGNIRDLPGISHQGTSAFGKKVHRGRKKEKAARKARKKNRR